MPQPVQVFVFGIVTAEWALTQESSPLVVRVSAYNFLQTEE
jgi:hypothetical protein